MAIHSGFEHALAQRGYQFTAGPGAAAIIAVQRVLARENWRRLVTGETAAAPYGTAKASADNAFGLLASGLGRLTAQMPVASRPDATA